MGISQAQRMIQQFQQQLGSPAFAQGAMGQLDAAGLGYINPRRFFGTPADEQLLRQQLMQQVLGGLGFGGYTGVQDLLGGAQVDRYAGGLTQLPGSEMTRSDITQRLPGPPQLIGDDQIIPRLTDIPTSGRYRSGVPDDISRPSGRYRSGVPDDISRQLGSGLTSRDFDISTRPADQAQLPVGAQVVGGTQLDTPQGSRSGLLFQAPASQVLDPGSGALGASQGGGVGYQFGQAGLPPLDATTQQQINNIFGAQLGAQQLSFKEKQQDLLNNLFGRGVNASTLATDAGGRLLYGQSQIENDILGQKSQAELGLRQQMWDNLMKKSLAGGGGGGGYSGGGGGMITGIAGDTSSLNPLTFEQKLALEKLGLERQGLEQQGSLGGRELDIRRELGMGELGLGRSGQQQDLLRFILGQGFARQQGAAGLAAGEQGRLTGYLGQLGQTQAGLAGQSAQMEAQRRSLLSQILGGAASLGGSLLGAAGSAGGFGQLFG